MLSLYDVLDEKEDMDHCAHNIFWLYDISLSTHVAPWSTCIITGKNVGFDNMINDDYDIYLLILDNQEMGVDTTTFGTTKRHSFLSKVKQIIWHLLRDWRGT